MTTESPVSRVNILDIVSGGVNLQLASAETPEDAKHRRHKDILLFYGAFGFVIFLTILLLWITFLDSAATAQQRQWRWNGVTTIVAGFIGYLFGKSSKAS